MPIITYGGGGGKDTKIAYLPYQTGSLTYSGLTQYPSWAGYDPNKLTIGGVTSSINAGTFTATFTPVSGFSWWDGSTSAKSATWTMGKAALPAVTLEPTEIELTSKTLPETVTVTRKGNGAISATISPEIATISVSGNVISVQGDGTSGTATLTVNVAEGDNYLAAPNVGTVTVTTAYGGVYGVQWDGASTTALSRTDDAAGFSNPVPYISGASNYGSPFDDIMPWSGMVRSTDSEAGELVSIPKFWYRLSQNGVNLKIQISNTEADGFSVSPAHMNRGDGAGERDVVYVGRYHCASTYKSATGVKPQASITRATARSNIHNRGSNIWQMDFATRFTIWLLYIVEYANWNSQTTIGYGCGNNSSTANMGYTDSMPYHTGTTLSSRTTYGPGTQYRYIEGLWDNVLDWLDGCYNVSSGLNLILNPANFSDSSGGTSVGTPSSGYPSALTLNDTVFPMWRPSAANGSDSTYVPDSWRFSASYPVVGCGGDYSRSLDYGMFYLSRDSVSNSHGYVGCRLIKLP